MAFQRRRGQRLIIAFRVVRSLSSLNSASNAAEFPVWPTGTIAVLKILNLRRASCPATVIAKT